MLILPSIFAIASGAILGALLRWCFAIFLNPLFPFFPLGTLTANIFGCFLMGIFMALSKENIHFPIEMRLAIVTGFLGALTTFSAFSAETLTLFTDENYLWASIIIFCHVGGSLLATFSGIFLTKYFLYP